MLCGTDHIDVHIDDKLRRVVESGAVERFVVATDWQERFWEGGDWTPIEIIKTMIRELESAGKSPSDF